MAHLQLGEREGKKKEERERNAGVERRQERLGNAPQQALGEGERLSQAVPLAALPRRALASLLCPAPKSGSCQRRLPGAAAHPGGASKPPQVGWIQGCGFRIGQHPLFLGKMQQGQSQTPALILLLPWGESSIHPQWKSLQDPIHVPVPAAGIADILLGC